MSEHDDELTCGKGIAASSVLPEKLAAVMRGMSGLMQNHVRSLDSKEKNGQLEMEAYQRLATDYRKAGETLEALAALMRGYRSLPMATHDIPVLMDKASVDVFADLVTREKDLLAMLQTRVNEHEQMLAGMRGA